MTTRRGGGTWSEGWGGGHRERESLVAEIGQVNLGILPGITEIVFRALRTLKVRRADKLPSFIFSDTYLQNQTTVTGDYKAEPPSHHAYRSLASSPRGGQGGPGPSPHISC